MIVGIVGEPYDVIVYTVVLHTVEVVGQHVGFSHALAVQNNLCIRTLLAAGKSCLLQKIKETCPVRSAAVGIAAVLIISFTASFGLCAPKHSIGDLIAGLNEVRGNTCRLQLSQTILGIFIDLISQLGIIERFPCVGSPLLTWISPCVAIMEVKHEAEANILDAFSQSFHIFKVLAYGDIATFSGVDK